MKQPLGITFVVPGDCDATGVYQSDGGVDVFETDAPYLLNDGTSLTRPIPVVLVDGPVFSDTLGHAQSALAINMGGADPDPAPVDGGVVHGGTFVTHNGAQVVYTG